jgi:hypothetical protein
MRDNPRRMTQAERIISKFGTQQRLADALGCGQSVIAGWKKRGVVPVRQHLAVMDAAKKLDISLKPIDFFAGPVGEAKRPKARVAA